MPLRGGRCKERLKESAEEQAKVEMVMVMVVVVGNNNSFAILLVDRVGGGGIRAEIVERKRI